MKYLIVKDWYTTHGNHAGMVHMCKLLVKRYPSEYSLLMMPEQNEASSVGMNCIYNIVKKSWNRLLRHISYGKQIVIHFLPFIIHINKKDEVFLLEYIEPVANQWPLAKTIKMFSKAKIYGMAHQTPTKFEHVGITPQIIRSWTNDVDKVLTLGSSLTSYLIDVGVKKNKISTGFHYVDREYYQCLRKTPHKQLCVIMMGMTQRNYHMLSSIIEECDGVKWTICRGYQKQVDHLFDHRENVIIKGYLSETELKEEMSKADVSISIMEDTIGSNVITTSLSMGLVNVVSDVGSIRDYCNEDNSLFCRNIVSDFVNAINYLKSNPNMVMRMQQNAVKAAEKFDIKNIHAWFSSI